MDGRTDGWMDGWTDGRMHGCMDATHGCMDGWVDDVTTVWVRDTTETPLQRRGGNQFVSDSDRPGVETRIVSVEISCFSSPFVPDPVGCTSAMPQPRGGDRLL